MTNSSDPLRALSDAETFAGWMAGLTGMSPIGPYAYVHSPSGAAIHFVPLGLTPPETGLLVHQDHWHRKPDIVRSRILSVVGVNQKIPAKRTRVVTLTSEEMNDFLQKNHLHGPVKAKVRLGLSYQGVCVAAGAFAKPCPIHRGDRVVSSVEFVRFCTATGVNVLGGLHKLLNHYIKTFQPEDLMSSVDLEWSDGRGFAAFGFREIGRTPPAVFLVQNETLERFSPSRFSNEMRAALENPNPKEALNRIGYTQVCNRGNVKLAYP